MEPKYKRVLSAVLLLVNILQTHCQSIDIDDHKKIVSNLPAEHLLRGSGENHDERPADIARSQIDFDPHKHELPFTKEEVQTQERPMVFFNVEAQSVKMTESDLAVDPVTGQTIIKHINPYQEANEESEYMMRPTDVSLKNLQGFYVAGDRDPTQTTETVETANPVAVNLGPDSESEDIKTDLPPALADAIKLSDYLKLPKTTTTTASNIHPEIPQETDAYKIPDVPTIFKTKNQEESENLTNNFSTVEVPKETTTDGKTTDSTEESITDDASETHTEGKDNVYKLDSTKSGESNNKEESVTYGNVPSKSKEASTELPTSPEADVDTADFIGSRIGLDEGLLGPVVDNVGQQRTPKLDKAAPPNMDKRNLAAQHRAKVKLSKRETLISWLQDPWLRSPIGVLVPLRSSSIGRALAVWTDVTGERLNLTDLLIIGYDENGIGWLSKHNLQSSEGTTGVASALQKLLLKHQSVMSENKGDAALHACAWAAKLVPYDSALFIVTDSAPSDAQRLPAALRAIIDKRLKLYTIWTDPLYPSATSEQAVLELTKASKYTEGEFLDYHPVVAASNDAGNLASEASWNHNVYRTGGFEERMRTGRLDNGIRQKYETLLVRRINGGGPSALGIPVEEGVESLRIRIDGRIDRASLYPPTGPQIDLFNASAVNGFSAGSWLESTAPLEALLVFPMQTQPTDRKYAIMPAQDPTADEFQRKATVGLWRLSVRCSGCEYRVVVSALAPVGLDAMMIGEDTLRLQARGPIASVRETTLVDEYGTELAKLPFSRQPSASEEGVNAGSVGDESSMSTLVADVPLPMIKRSSKVYAKVVGRDIYGESFTRVSGPIFKQEVRTSRSASISFPDRRSDALQSTFNFPEERTEEPVERSQRLFFGNNQTSTVSPITPFATSQISSTAGTLLTTVQIGLSTRLYGAPGDNLQLHFEVTNYRERNINFRFEASGNLRFLRGIRPNSQWINSGQTANIIVDVGITNSAQVGARDLITFTAYGLEQVSISAYVYVISSELQIQTDVWAPNVRHTIQGDCMAKQGDDCARNSWAATIYARDNDGGLLRLSSSPVGLRYENTFIAGTREEVTATYRATCCAPRILINAVDANGNANTYTIDVTYYIPEAAIAAIVLGVLLLIALIALIAFLVYLCIRRRKESRQLPSYATPRREA